MPWHVARDLGSIERKESECFCPEDMLQPELCGMHHLLVTVADPGGGPWGPAPLALKISSKLCSFQAILGENLYFEQIVGSGPPLGSKLHWAPLTEILDPRLGHISFVVRQFVYFCSVIVNYACLQVLVW